MFHGCNLIPPYDVTHAKTAFNEGSTIFEPNLWALPNQCLTKCGLQKKFEEEAQLKLLLKREIRKKQQRKKKAENKRKTHEEFEEYNDGCATSSSRSEDKEATEPYQGSESEEGEELPLRPFLELAQEERKKRPKPPKNSEINTKMKTKQQKDCWSCEREVQVRSERQKEKEKKPDEAKEQATTQVLKQPRKEEEVNEKLQCRKSNLVIDLTHEPTTWRLSKTRQTPAEGRKTKLSDQANTRTQRKSVFLMFCSHPFAAKNLKRANLITSNT